MRAVAALTVRDDLAVGAHPCGDGLAMPKGVYDLDPKTRRGSGAMSAFALDLAMAAAALTVIVALAVWL